MQKIRSPPFSIYTTKSFECTRFPHISFFTVMPPHFLYSAGLSTPHTHFAPLYCGPIIWRSEPSSIMESTAFYPFRTFNTSGLNYTGPVFGDLEYVRLWTYLALLKSSCLSEIGTGTYQWTHLVSECCMRNMSELQKANLASYTFLLSLWPASIALFAFMAPDASYAA